MSKGKFRMDDYYLRGNQSLDAIESNAYDVLELMLKDMEFAEERYKPTNFWNSGLRSIVDDIQTQGFRSFREHQSAHFFYVPNYSKYSRINWSSLLLLKLIMAFLRASGKKKYIDFLHRNLSGLSEAKKDYQIFYAANLDKNPALRNVSESTIGGGERFIFDDRYYSKSFLNYLRALSLLKKKADTRCLHSVLEIGGGYGTLGEILLKASDKSFYVDVDIPPVAAVATYYLKSVFGSENVLSYDQSREMDEINLGSLNGKFKCVVLCPWQLPKVTGKVDLFANLISFQEMEPEVVRNYASLVQPITRYFVLLRNSKYGKDVAEKQGDIGVLNPVTNDMVIKMLDQFEVIGRNSSVFGNAYERVNFYSEVICLERTEPQ